MDGLHLIQSTNTQEVDLILQAIVGIYTQAFPYLLGLLQQDEDDKIFALERLTHVVYADEEMVRALQALSGCDVEEIRQAAHHAQEYIQMMDNKT